MRWRKRLKLGKMGELLKLRKFMKKIERVHLKEIPFLPNGEPSEPWGSTLKSIQNYFSSYPSSPSVRAASYLLEGDWAILMHYIYREKWNKKHKFPTMKEKSRLYAEHLIAILELCIQIHAIYPVSKFYDNAAQWFDLICWEFKNSSKEELQKSEGIKEKIKKYREILYFLKGFRKPPESGIHFSRLVEAATEIHMENITPNLINSYWKGMYFREGKNCNGLIRSLTKFVSFLDRKENNILFSDGEKLYIQKGKGKARILISEKCINYILN